MFVIKKENVFILLSIIVALFIFQGCAASRLDRAQSSVRNGFVSGDYENTAKLIEHYDKKNIYKERDKVLMLLEKGTALHFAGAYDSSFVAFEQAEKEMDRLFSKSISRGIASFMINDNILAYNGEDYESIYLNALNSLNYLHRKNYEDALVEARQIAYKLQRLNIKYQGIVTALSEADTNNQVKWKSGKANIQNSTFGHFLSGVLYARTGHPDDARIEYEQMLKAFNNQSSFFPYTSSGSETLSRLKQPDQYNTLFVCFSGEAPVKYQVDTRVYLQREDFYLKLSLPVLRTVPSNVYSVYALINDTLRIPLYKIENMDEVAMEVYKVKEPIIYARTFVRALAKATGTNITKAKLKKGGIKILSGIVNLFGKIATEATEKADLRSWQTMPGQVYVNLYKLPAGTHKLTIEYVSYNGRLLFEDHKKITIANDKALEVAESLFSN